MERVDKIRLLYEVCTWFWYRMEDEGFNVERAEVEQQIFGAKVDLVAELTAYGKDGEPQRAKVNVLKLGDSIKYRIAFHSPKYTELKQLFTLPELINVIAVKFKKGLEIPAKEPEPVLCPDCEGSGMFYHPTDEKKDAVICERCTGTGVVVP